MSRNSAVSAISSSFAERVFTFRRSALTSFLSSLVFRVTLFQEHFFMINAGMVTMFPGSRTERDVFD